MACKPGGNPKEMLKQTIAQVDEKFQVVGVLNYWNETLTVLEALMPEYFTDATKLFYEFEASKRRVPVGPGTTDESQELKDLVCTRFPEDCELHEFLVKRLLMQYKQLKKQ